MESLGVVILILSLNWATRNAANASERRRRELSKAIKKGGKRTTFILIECKLVYTLFFVVFIYVRNSILLVYFPKGWRRIYEAPSVFGSLVFLGLRLIPGSPAVHFIIVKLKIEKQKKQNKIRDWNGIGYEWNSSCSFRPRSSLVHLEKNISFKLIFLLTCFSKAVPLDLLFINAI